MRVEEYFEGKKEHVKSFYRINPSNRYYDAVIYVSTDSYFGSLFVFGRKSTVSTPGGMDAILFCGQSYKLERYIASLSLDVTKKSEFLPASVL